MTTKRPLLHLFVFLIALLPFASSYTHIHPDERHYADGAIKMLETGDWLTPQTAYGETRLLKPVIGYWLEAGSFSLFGVSALSSRLPMLLAGAATIALTYVLGRKLGYSRQVATTASAILLSNPIHWSNSTHSIPDSLLCPALLLSGIGFLQILLNDRRTFGTYAAAYLGAGLAIAIKGILPLAFVVYVFAFAAWQRKHIRQLVHLPTMLTGSLIAGAWFGMMYLLHSDLLTDHFLGDQITKKASSESFFTNTFLYLLSYLLLLLPWTLPFAITWFRSSSVEATVQFRRFTIGWSLFLAIIFGCGYRVTPRYLQPALPFLSLLIADFFCRHNSFYKRPMTWLFYLMILTMLAITPLIGAIHWQMGGSFILGTACAFLSLILVIAHKRRLINPVEAITFAMIAIQAFLWQGVRPILEPNSTYQIVKTLKELGIKERHPIVLFGPDRTASRLTVESGAQWKFLAYRPKKETPKVTDKTIIVGPTTDIPADALSGRTVYHVRADIKQLRAREVLRVIWNGNLASYMASHRKDFVISKSTPETNETQK